MRGRRREQQVGTLVSAALRGLGVPSQRVTTALQEAFDAALEPAWRGQVRLEALQAGVLDIGVSSAALREEIAQFHAPRLLAVLRAACPDIPLARLRVLSSAPAPAAAPATAPVPARTPAAAAALPSHPPAGAPRARREEHR